MDSQAFNAGRSAYQRGDFAQAQMLLAQAKAPGEVNGAIDHLRGNALMRLGMYADAAQAYGQALADVSYGKSGALNTNRGRAFLAAGRPDAAIAALTQAQADESYPTPYKIQTALGEAYEQMGQPREAGAAWRNAAIDETNPNPSQALEKLGGCFMQLGRPMDAVEAYRTALDFSVPQASQNAVYASLGEAYVAANRMAEAADAFNHALADGTYQLTPSQSAAHSACANAMAASGATGRGETDAMLAAAGYGGTGPVAGNSGMIDPLDPLGSSGEFIPSPEDTGFFEISEQDIVDHARQQAKVERKKKHTGLKVLIFVLVICALLAGGGAWAYVSGYGWPTQTQVVSDLFQAKTSGTGLDSLLAPGLSDASINEIDAIIPSGATVSVNGIDKSMSESTVHATATLPQGGTQNYVFHLVRDGIGWKVSSAELSFDSTSDSATTDTTTTTTTTDTADSATTTTTDTTATETTTQDGQTSDTVTADEAETVVDANDAQLSEGESAGATE